MPNKVILIDSSGIFVPTVKVCNRLKMQKAQTGFPPFVMPSHVMYFNSLISSLSKIGIDESDIIIMAEEGHSWRKDLASFYKAQREGLREKDTFTDWKHEFEMLNKLHSQLNNATNWYFVRHNNLEADDIIAIAVRYFKDKDVVIVSGDKDLFQLAWYKNVKIFTLNKKINGSKGMYEEVKNPLKIIDDKCKKGDPGDNIIPEPNETEEDYELRRVLVNLLELPPEIEKKGIDTLNEVLSYSKSLHLEYLPEFKGVQDKFLKIYKKEKVITSDYCKQLIEKRVIKKKKKEADKRKEKKNETL
jgi:5'-3' exonuclease